MAVIVLSKQASSSRRAAAASLFTPSKFGRYLTGFELQERTSSRSLQRLARLLLLLLLLLPA